MKKFFELVLRYNELVQENKAYRRKESLYYSVYYKDYLNYPTGKFKGLFEDLNSEIDLLRIPIKDEYGCMKHMPVGVLEQKQIKIEIIRLFLGKAYKKDIELFDSGSSEPPQKYKVDDIFMESYDYINPISEYMGKYCLSVRGRKYNTTGKIGLIKTVARLMVEVDAETQNLSIDSIYIAGRIS